MRYLLTLFLILMLLGCDDKEMPIEDTIFTYYETMLQGEMKKSQELLDWDVKEASIIEYYANLGELLHHIVSVEDFEITKLSESNGKASTDVKITYALKF